MMLSIPQTGPFTEWRWYYFRQQFYHCDFFGSQKMASTHSVCKTRWRPFLSIAVCPASTEIRSGRFRAGSQRALLTASEFSAPAARRGRPKKSTSEAIAAKSIKKKRNLSPEGRARIAEAVKRRWTLQKAKQKSRN
jgi:hypothetical protein